MLQSLVAIFLATIITLSAYADGTHPVGIALDGTVGPAGRLDLPGPNYEIKAEYGEHAGSNLFHSFRQFNIHSGESATFTGPNSVQNIVSRVTGGGASWIDGRLGSAIPNAGLWFLNPAGVMFGPNASLDLSGSFHVSTADYLRLGQNDRFYAMPHADEVISVAAPTAFGFLDNHAGPVSIQGRGEMTETEWNENPTGLQVSEGNALSLISGDIEIKNGTFYQTGEVDENGVAEIVQTGEIRAPAGQINMAAVASPGEVVLTGSGLVLSSIEKKGHISLSEKSKVATDSHGGGRIDIQADTLSLSDRAVISGLSDGPGDGGTILIDAREITMDNGALIDTGTSGSGDGGTILINAGDLLKVTGTGQGDYLPTGILSNSLSNESDAGHAGKIKIDAGEVILTDRSKIGGMTYGPGDGGTVEIEAREITMTRAGMIRTCTYSSGDGGTVFIKVRDLLSISETGGMNADIPSGPGSNTFSEESDAGDAGKVEIDAREIILTDGGEIRTLTFGPGGGGTIGIDSPEISLSNGGVVRACSFGSGDGGHVEIVSDTLTASGVAGQFTGVFSNSNSKEPDSGRGGELSLSIQKVSLDNNGAIGTVNRGGGDAGIINLDAGKLELSDRAWISSVSEAETNGGDAGTINISADAVSLSGESFIASESQSGGGGNMTIDAKERIHLSDSDIRNSIRYGGEEAGGSFHIESEFVVLNHSRIKTGVHEGEGGDIHIRGNFVSSSDSSVDASGQLTIESPDMDISGDLTVLPETFMDASRWMRTPCAQRSGETVSRLVMAGPDAAAFIFGDLQGSPPPRVYFLNLDGPKELKEKDALDSLILNGDASHKAGKLRHAAQMWEKAATLSLDEPDPSAYSDILMHLARVYQILGFHEKSLSLLTDALSVAEKSDDRYRKAVILSGLGDIHLSLGYRDDSAAYLNEGLKEARSLPPGPKRDYVLASALNHLGNADAANEAFQDALAAYAEGLSLIRESRDADRMKSKILMNLLFLASETGSPEESSSALHDILAHVGTLPDTYSTATDMISLTRIIQNIAHRHKGRNLLKIGSALFSLGQGIPGKPASYQLFAISFDLLNRAAEIGAAIGNTRILSCAHGYAGQWYESQRRYTEALPATRRAIFFADQENIPEILYLWQWQLGRLFRDTGKTDEAVNAFEKAVAVLNPIRGELSKGYRFQSDLFDEQIRPVYLGLAELRLIQAETVDKTYRQERLRDAMNAMERLKRAELQNFFQDECLRPSSESVSYRVPDHAAVIYPIALADRLVLLLIMGDEIQASHVPVRSDDLDKTVRAFRRQLQTRSAYLFRENAEKLYDWLIRPLDPALGSRAIDTLIIAPDGALRLIPFSALHDRDQFLFERYALGVIPGITLTDPSPSEMRNAPILLAGISEGVRDFPPLPSVKAELRDVGEIMKAGAVLHNQDYTIENLTAEFRRHAYSVLHLATHGVFDRTSQNSFLLTYNDRLTLNGLERLIHIGRFRENPVELLTLSACQTAIGDERAAMGLAGIAVKAGAKSAMATLWYVDDRATSQLIKVFYQQLSQPGATKAKALQQAQRWLMSQRGYRHPIYWAPFLMIGNWL